MKDNTYILSTDRLWLVFHLVTTMKVHTYILCTDRLCLVFHLVTTMKDHTYILCTDRLWLVFHLVTTMKDHTYILCTDRLWLVFHLVTTMKDHTYILCRWTVVITTEGRLHLWIAATIGFKKYDFYLIHLTCVESSATSSTTSSRSWLHFVQPMLRSRNLLSG